MSNNGQAIQAFDKKAEGGISGVAPWALMVSGAGLAGIAILTAAMPVQGGAIGSVVNILNRVGLDKGPLFLFGATIGALGFALARFEKAARAASANQDELGFGEQIADDLEGQAAIMAALQGEVGAARAELAELHRETHSMAESQKNNTASDPMFRLAASLDQLGAQIGRHLDAVAKTVLSSMEPIQMGVIAIEGRVDALDGRVKDDSQNQQTTEELKSLRNQIAGLTDSVDKLASEVEAIEIPAPAQVEPQLPWELAEPASAEPPTEVAEVTTTEPAAEPTPVPHAEPMHMDAVEPQPESTISDTEPAGPMPWTTEAAAEDPAAPSVSRHEGTPMDLKIGPIMAPLPEDTGSHVAPIDPTSETKAQQTPAEFEQPTLFGPKLTPVMPVQDEFPSPPAPMPKPAEGLGLIDEMNEDKARIADLTPPLFPELGDGSNGQA